MKMNPSGFAGLFTQASSYTSIEKKTNKKSEKIESAFDYWGKYRIEKKIWGNFGLQPLFRDSFLQRQIAN